jgi:hypothetical protein
MRLQFAKSKRSARLQKQVEVVADPFRRSAFASTCQQLSLVGWIAPSSLCSDMKLELCFLLRSTSCPVWCFPISASTRYPILTSASAFVRRDS